MPWQKISFPFSNPNAFVFSSQRPSMKHRLSLRDISLFTTTTAFSLTPSSLLFKNDAYLRNSSLSYLWWFYFCLFLLEQFIRRGFFICGHSPRILARASRRASTVCQPRKVRYLPPVNGHFRSLAWSAALLLCPARTDIGCTSVSSLHFSLPCPHSTHGTRIPGSGISIFAPGTSRTASGCFFLSATP